MLLGSVPAFGALMAAMPARASIERMNGFAGTVPLSQARGGDQTLPPWGIPAAGNGQAIFNANPKGPSGIYRLDFYGAEATFLTQFVRDGNVIFTHTGDDTINASPSPTPHAVPGPVFTSKGNGHSLLDFSFWINSNSGNALDNGASNPPVVGAPDFAITVNPNT
jgi:hypothetical protein